MHWHFLAARMAVSLAPFIRARRLIADYAAAQINALAESVKQLVPVVDEVFETLPRRAGVEAQRSPYGPRDRRRR